MVEENVIEEKITVEEKSAVEQRLEAMRKNAPRQGEMFIYMKRVPTETYNDFREISKDFCYDYGMTLKALVDHFKNKMLLNDMVMQHSIMINDLQEQINNKEIKSEKKEEKKMANGKTLEENKRLGLI